MSSWENLFNENQRIFFLLILKSKENEHFPQISVRFSSFHMFPFETIKINLKFMKKSVHESNFHQNHNEST